MCSELTVNEISNHRSRILKISFGSFLSISLVSAFVFSRLDYCNAILAGLPKTTVAPLQRVQNAAARLVAGLGPCDHVSNALTCFIVLHCVLAAFC